MVFLARLVLSWPAGCAAGVLPAFAGVVPVEAQLGELGAYGLGRRFGELNPDPFADNFGKAVELGKVLADKG